MLQLELFNANAIRNHPLFDSVPSKNLDDFFSFHEANPQVYSLFEEVALDHLNSGKKFGAKSIMEGIRWQYTLDKTCEYKINNSHTSYFARLLTIQNSKFVGYFEFR